MICPAGGMIDCNIMGSAFLHSSYREAAAKEEADRLQSAGATACFASRLICCWRELCRTHRSTQQVLALEDVESRPVMVAESRSAAKT